MQKFTEKFKYDEGGYLIHKTGRNKGLRAGSFDPSSGYFRVKYKGKTYLTHRVIYLIHHPEYVGDIDHKDRDKLNNRIENLRPCNRPQNVVNSYIRSDNKSGYKGVVFHKATGKFQAQTMYFGKRIHLGLFQCPKEAAEAYNNKVKELFGEFAKINEL